MPGPAMRHDRSTSPPMTNGAAGSPMPGGGSGHGMGAPPPSKQSAEALRVVKIARRWVGQNFHAGQEAQCANFVREVFREAKVTVGDSRNPIDRRLLAKTEVLAPSYANSFAGDDVGLRVQRNDMRPGDLVMFENTYGNYAKGVLTHVAIYVGDGMIVHRPTKSGPVALDSINHFRKIGDIRRPLAYKARMVAHSGSAKCFVHDMEAAAFMGGAKVRNADIRIHMHNGHVEAYVNGRKVDPVSLSLQLFY